MLSLRLRLMLMLTTMETMDMETLDTLPWDTPTLDTPPWDTPTLDTPPFLTPGPMESAAMCAHTPPPMLLAPMSAPMDMVCGLLERGLLMLSLKLRLMLMLTTMETMAMVTLDTPPLDTPPCPMPDHTPMPPVPSSPPALATDPWVTLPVPILGILMVPTPPLDEHNYLDIPSCNCTIYQIQ